MEKINNILENFPILQFEIFNNSLSQWAMALIVLFLCWIILKIFKTVIVLRLKSLSQKTKTEIDDMLINAIDAIHWPFYFLISLYIALRFVSVASIVDRIAYYIIIIAVVYYVIRFLEKIIDFGTKIFIEKKEEQEENAGILKLLSSVIKLLLWVGAIVLVLSNMGYNVTSLIAGLGIGGIAIALAVQSILGDLFSSLTLYLDKPFKTGDFIALGDQMGTVKKIGIKTTRIQVPQGEELVVSNTDLTTAKVRNFGVMERRRNSFSIGVAYETPAEKLKKIPGWIQEIIEVEEGAEFDRAHFSTFGDFSLGFDIVYYLNSGDYVEFMDMQQKINLAILEKFTKEKIEIAFPTQTVYLKK